MYEATVSISQPQHLLSLFGFRDQNVRAIRDVLGVMITHRDGEIRVVGETEPPVIQARKVLEKMRDLAERDGMVPLDQVQQLLYPLNGSAATSHPPSIDVFSTGRTIRPRTPGQAVYVQAIRDNPIVVAVGPAGTGKTYLAVALAVQALKNHAVRKVVLVRPAVEAGESLGFLPGDMQAKINPYLRPLLDALQEMVDFDQVRKFMENGVIEVVPLAYMRGRTLNEAFIILDEAQNTTISQMKMFLTRMGENSRIVIAGDTTQIDLPPHTRSGLIDALRRLRGIAGICPIELTTSDIVRHRLVQEIVHAYENTGEQRSRPESLSAKGSDPVEAVHFSRNSGAAGEGQTPFRTGSEYGSAMGEEDD